MKQVFSNREVVHVWASRTQDSGRNSGRSIWFQGDTLYSYNEPIARFVGDNRALLSSRKFSVTTSGHQHYARVAVCHYSTVSAPFVAERYVDLDEIHKKNLTYWENALIRRLDLYAAYPRRKSILNEITGLKRDHRAYSDFFELNWSDLDVSSIRTAIEESERKAEARRAHAAAEAEKVRQQRIVEEQENLAKWRNHEPVGDFRFESTRLRLSRDLSWIETTHGARVPVEVAPRLWRAACHQRAAHQEVTVLDAPSVGIYKLNRVTANGDLIIGCHTIPFSELELMAQQLGYIKEEIAA